MKEKKLKLFNGRWDGAKGRAYVAAYSNKDCVELLRQAGHTIMSLYELNGWWSKGAWGNSMDGITPERGVWLQRDGDGKPERIL
jgi:hypothetical protein